MDPSDLTPAHLAHAAKVSEARLWELANDIENQYFPSRVECIKGKRRVIDQPKPAFKLILQRIQRAFQAWHLYHPAAHGGVKGRSYLTSARCHCGAAFIVTRDIKDAYPSIKPEALHCRLSARGFSRETAELLTRLMTVHGRVPQGSPLSSEAINIFFYEADQSIATICGRLSARYHRNFDDLVISAPAGPIARSLDRHQLGHILDSEISKLGLRVNVKKRTLKGLQPSRKLQTVHNVVVNNPDGIGLPPKQAREVLSLAESYVASARAVSCDSLKSLYKKRQRLLGWYYCARQYDFSPAKHLYTLLQQGDRIVQGWLHRHGIVPYRNQWWRGISGQSSVADLAVILRQRQLAA